jgi:hypothetical protein
VPFGVYFSQFEAFGFTLVSSKLFTFIRYFLASTNLSVEQEAQSAGWCAMWQLRRGQHFEMQNQETNSTGMNALTMKTLFVSHSPIDALVISNRTQ